jgi:predicted RNA-binding protein
MGYTIEWKHSDIIVKFDGKLIKEDILSVDNHIYGNSKFDKMKYQIFDYSRVTEVELSEADVKMISILDKSSTIWNNHVRVAIITDNVKILGLAEIYRAILIDTKWLVEIFTNFDEALAWCTET